jgi:hypothetical protein
MGDEEEEQPAGEAIASDMPDWLSQALPADETAEAEPLEMAASTEDEMGWSAGVGESGIEDTESATVPDWLAGVEPVDAMSVMSGITDADTEETHEDESSLDWMSEPEAASESPAWLSEMDEATEADEEALPTVSDAEWLSSIGVQQPSAAAPAEEPEEPVEAGALGDFDWLGAISAQEEVAAVPQMQAEEQPLSSKFDNFDWGQDVADAEQELTAESTSVESGDWDQAALQAEATQQPSQSVAAEMAQAGNAPDWLNAMVPGLDLDYEAPEDEPIEQEFIEGAAHRARADAPMTDTSEFAWLNKVVEAEIRSAEPPARKRHFVFSHPPAWLQTPVASMPAPAAVVEAPTAASKGDLPPWLSFDADQPVAEGDDFELPDDWLK